jgi:hypothetical protein
MPKILVNNQANTNKGINKANVVMQHKYTQKYKRQVLYFNPSVQKSIQFKAFMYVQARET